MKEVIKLTGWTWVKVLDFAWKLQELAQKKSESSFDCRTIELIYGPAIAEALIRYFGEALQKLLPTPEKIEQNYLMFGGKSDKLQLLKKCLPAASELAGEFALISGDKNVAVGASMPSMSQAICVLAHTLPPEPRQMFQEKFIWDSSRRLVLNDDEQSLWYGFERQLGIGILASIWHAKQEVPDLTPEEFATALLRKYGIPMDVDGKETVYACHWCGTGPCSCGGGKAPARKVTYEDAARNINRCGPLDTQAGMYFPYAWANIARGGAGYGPLRALIEAATEKGAVLADMGSQKALERRFGPLLISQQRHIAEITHRFGQDEDTARKAKLSELADAVHWQFAGYGPGVFDHTAGLKQGLQITGDYCGVNLEFPVPSYHHPL